MTRRSTPDEPREGNDVTADAQERRRTDSVTWTGGAGVGRQRRLRTIAVGLGSGFVATVVMTVFRMPLSNSLPPTADFWAQYVGGGEPEEYPILGLVLHVAYGMAGGALFAALTDIRSRDREVAREGQGALLGLVYGLALSVFGVRVLLERLLDKNLDADERFVFHVSHVIYGITLGVWVGSRVE